jgi:hypothetical protein
MKPLADQNDNDAFHSCPTPLCFIWPNGLTRFIVEKQ